MIRTIEEVTMAVMLLAAIQTQARVRIDYTDEDGEITSRSITPHQLTFTDAGVFVVPAYCHRRKALRTFRFDRIGSVDDN
jgi:predicted DNA-binding transcriptional regulator YafY